jgi:RHS repeat-associated protein
LTWTLLTPVVLASGEALWENQTRVSLDGAYRLQYQGDGNLVVVRLADESYAWSSQTNGTSVWVTVMQGDGNLVVYDADGVPVWNSGTAGYDGARLEIANDTMAIVAPDNTTLWSVSLAAEPALPKAWAGATMGALLGASSGPAGRAAGVLLGVIALFGLAARAVRRLCSMGGPQAASRELHIGRRLRARVSATALLLAAMLLVPATALAQIPTQQVEYYHTDALGSVRAVTKQVNGEWQVVARHDFMPFGEEVAPPSPPQEKRLFTGKERDNETGMDYFEARYYRAGLGRFATVDRGGAGARIGDPSSWNAYAYARNNPIKYVDPDGLSYVLFSRLDQKLYLFDKDGRLVGTYDAANNLVDGAYELRDGTYPFKHTDSPRLDTGDTRFTEDGSFGPHGIFHLKDFTGADGKTHQYIGIHSGRRNKKGYQHPTEGCIRTTDEGMSAMVDLAKNDPLTSLFVQDSSVIVVRPVVVTIRVSFIYVPGIAVLVPVVTSVSVSLGQ